MNKVGVISIVGGGEWLGAAPDWLVRLLFRSWKNKLLMDQGRKEKKNIGAQPARAGARRPARCQLLLYTS
jgi:hypothetical protein